MLHGEIEIDIIHYQGKHTAKQPSVADQYEVGRRTAVFGFETLDEGHESLLDVQEALSAIDVSLLASAERPFLRHAFVLRPACGIRSPFEKSAVVLAQSIDNLVGCGQPVGNDPGCLYRSQQRAGANAPYGQSLKPRRHLCGLCPACLGEAVLQPTIRELLEEIRLAFLVPARNRSS